MASPDASPVKSRGVLGRLAQPPSAKRLSLCGEPVPRYPIGPTMIPSSALLAAVFLTLPPPLSFVQARTSLRATCPFASSPMAPGRSEACPCWCGRCEAPRVEAPGRNRKPNPISRKINGSLWVVEEVRSRVHFPISLSNLSPSLWWCLRFAVLPYRLDLCFACYVLFVGMAIAPQRHVSDAGRPYRGSTALRQ